MSNTTPHIPELLMTCVASHCWLALSIRGCLTDICNNVQFLQEGCENCQFLDMQHNRHRCEDCTTINFQGIITVLDPTSSWAAKWLHMGKKPATAHTGCVLHSAQSGALHQSPHCCWILPVTSRLGLVFSAMVCPRADLSPIFGQRQHRMYCGDSF